MQVKPLIHNQFEYKLVKKKSFWQTDEDKQESLNIYNFAVEPLFSGSQSYPRD